MLDALERELGPQPSFQITKLDRLDRLDIDGHTDDIGDAEDNLTLSESRAEAVKAFLVDCGIEEGRMTTQGHGESQPKTTNATPEGRRVNRRTEFRWVN